MDVMIGMCDFTHQHKARLIVKGKVFRMMRFHCDILADFLRMNKQRFQHGRADAGSAQLFFCEKQIQMQVITLYEFLNPAARKHIPAFDDMPYAFYRPQSCQHGNHFQIQPEQLQMILQRLFQSGIPYHHDTFAFCTIRQKMTVWLQCLYIVAKQVAQGL